MQFHILGLFDVSGLKMWFCIESLLLPLLLDSGNTNWGHIKFPAFHFLDHIDSMNSDNKLV